MAPCELLISTELDVFLFVCSIYFGRSSLEGNTMIPPRKCSIDGPWYSIGDCKAYRRLAVCGKAPACFTSN
jgi:hypothetical protein